MRFCVIAFNYTEFLKEPQSYTKESFRQIGNNLFFAI